MGQALYPWLVLAHSYAGMQDDPVQALVAQWLWAAGMPRWLRGIAESNGRLKGSPLSGGAGTAARSAYGSTAARKSSMSIGSWYRRACACSADDSSDALPVHLPPRVHERGCAKPPTHHLRAGQPTQPSPAVLDHAEADGVEAEALERRVADDGNSYTREEFVEYFGGVAEWDAAAPLRSDC